MGASPYRLVVVVDPQWLHEDGCVALGLGHFSHPRLGRFS